MTGSQPAALPLSYGHPQAHACTASWSDPLRLCPGASIRGWGDSLHVAWPEVAAHIPPRLSPNAAVRSAWTHPKWIETVENRKARDPCGRRASGCQSLKGVRLGAALSRVVGVCQLFKARMAATPMRQCRRCAMGPGVVMRQRGQRRHARNPSRTGLLAGDEALGIHDDAYEVGVGVTGCLEKL